MHHGTLQRLPDKAAQGDGLRLVKIAVQGQIGEEGIARTGHSPVDAGNKFAGAVGEAEKTFVDKDGGGYGAVFQIQGACAGDCFPVRSLFQIHHEVLRPVNQRAGIAACRNVVKRNFQGRLPVGGLLFLVKVRIPCNDIPAER
ncbi:hypothetical protein Barb4_02173 [Bacteroidales bacterium Barb4]|nr:hypothetical protein Barb4_02173 [Bacteroidales bacterium Barb4]